MLNEESELPALEGGKKTRSEFLVFGKPRFTEEEIAEVTAVLRSGWVGTGPRCAQLEKDFSAYIGVSHAVALNSCTAALHLAVECLELAPGDEVIVPAMTFCATANAVIHAGGTPVFADVDFERQSLTAETLERAVSPRTRAIVVVHFAGRSAPMDEIMQFANQRGIKVIEDCAHAIETEWRGKHVGTFGWVGCFSFYATKNVSTAEGGMLVTNDEKLAIRARKLSLHGLSKDAHKRFTAAGYTHVAYEEVGFKYNMPDIAAALGIHQLKRVEANHALREQLWNVYCEGLHDLPLRLPAQVGTSVANGNGSAGRTKVAAGRPADRSERHAYHLFQLRVDAKLRDKLLTAYASEGIGVGVHYLALTLSPLYAKYIKPGQKFEVAETISAQTLSLPIGTAMSDQDAQDAVKATRKLLRYYLAK